MASFAEMCERILTEEGKKTTVKSFTREARPNPFNPRVLYMFEHVDKAKISAIKNRMTRGEITGEVMMKLLIEETNACAPAEEEEELPEEDLEEDMEEDMEEDEFCDDNEEDGEMGKPLQVGDQQKPGIAKRPQSFLVQSQLECKKPRVAQGLGLPGEPVTAEM